MTTLKQLQEKDWTVDTDDKNRNFIKYKDGRMEFIGDDWAIICFLHKKVCDGSQQITLAYNAGKAEMLDTVLKEIDKKLNSIGRPVEGISQELYNNDTWVNIGILEALDTLKNKLLDNK